MCTLTRIDWGCAEQAVNEDYLVDDPIEAYIQQLFAFTGKHEDTVTVPLVSNQLMVYQIRPSKATTMTIASAMKRMGVEKDRKRMGDGRFYVYHKVKLRGIVAEQGIF